MRGGKAHSCAGLYIGSLEQGIWCPPKGYELVHIGLGPGSPEVLQKKALAFLKKVGEYPEYPDFEVETLDRRASKLTWHYSTKENPNEAKELVFRAAAPGIKHLLRHIAKASVGLPRVYLFSDGTDLEPWVQEAPVVPPVSLAAVQIDF
jgi:hypothetical protein